MAMNMKEAMQTIMNQNWTKKISEAKQRTRSLGLVLQLHSLMTMSREDWAQSMKYTYGKHCQRTFKDKFSNVCFPTVLTKYSIMCQSFYSLIVSKDNTKRNCLVI